MALCINALRHPVGLDSTVCNLTVKNTQQFEASRATKKYDEER